MGKTPTDIEGEIADVRGDTELIIEELERRARRLLNVQYYAEQHPTTAAAVGVGVVLALGAIAFGLFELFRPKEPEPGLTGLFKRLTDRVQSRLPLEIYVTTKTTEQRRQRQRMANRVMTRASGALVGVITSAMTRSIAGALGTSRSAR